MFQWGITGLMGSGKSLARRYLESKGYPAIDADDVARVLLSPAYPQNLQELQRIFGPEALLSSGEMDRALVRRAISESQPLRDRFESWIHPLIRRHNENFAEEARALKAPIAFIEGTRLIESGAHKRLDGIILISLSMENRLARLRSRSGGISDEMEKLARTQNEKLMRDHASVIWSNDGAPEDLYRKIDLWLAQVLGK